MKALRLRETATQYKTTRNRYGDLVLASSGTILCLFRNVTDLQRGPNAEEVLVSGIFWFDPRATVRKGDVVGFGGQLYRLERVTIANQRLTTNATHFIKCTASLYRAIS